MTRKQRRFTLITTCLAILGVAVGLVLYALDDALLFFYTPTDVVEKQITPGERFRLGGLVAENSVKRGQGTFVTFAVTDSARTITVNYDGILPELFREGQGIVAEGKLVAGGNFAADTVLAKHDENYMPAEVADALKKQGHWKEGAEGSATASPGS